MATTSMSNLSLALGIPERPVACNAMLDDLSAGRGTVYFENRAGGLTELGAVRSLDLRRDFDEDRLTLELVMPRRRGSVDALWGVKPIVRPFLPTTVDVKLFAQEMAQQLKRSSEILEPYVNLNERCTLSPTPTTKRKKPTPPPRRPEDPFTPGKAPKTAKWRVREFTQADGRVIQSNGVIRVVSERFMTAAEWKSFAAGLAAAGVAAPATWTDEQGLIGAPIRYEAQSCTVITLFREAL